MESHHCMKHVLEAILPVLNNFWNMALMYVYYIGLTFSLFAIFMPLFFLFLCFTMH